MNVEGGIWIEKLIACEMVEKIMQKEDGWGYFIYFMNEFFQQGEIRVFVPPLDEATMLCLMLPKNECSGNIYSNGITILEKMEHDEWKIRVLDGTLATVENGIAIPLKSAIVTGWYYNYERMDGTFADSRDSLVYLPALPILLLR